MIRFALLCDIRPNRAVQEGPLRAGQPQIARAAEYVRTAEVMARHRREMLNQVYLPLAGVVLLIVVVMAGIAIAFSPDKIGTVAAFMSLLILVPSVLVCLIPYLLFVALAFGVNWLNRWLPRRLRTTRRVVHTANEGSYQVARRVVNPIIWVSQRLAWAERFLGAKPPKAFPITDRKV